MQAILTQDNFIEALKGEALMSSHLTQPEKVKMVYKAKGNIILFHGVKFLR